MYFLLIFVAVLLLSLGIMLYFLKSTRTEVALQRHLESISDTFKDRSNVDSILKEERLSPTPWVHDLLMKTPGALSLLELIQQAGKDWWVSSVILNSVILFFSGWLLAVIWVDAAVLQLMAAVAAGILPGGYLYFLRRKKLQACDALLSEAVDLMARALRAGHALTSALEMVSLELAEPLASEFRTVYEEQALGLPLRDALMNLLRRIPRDDMRFFITALLLQKETGGNLANILDKTSFVMRERRRLRGQIRIYTAQARASGWVVGLLPFVMFVLLSIVNPEYEPQLFNDPLGIRLVYGGLVLLVVGIIVIKNIVDIRV